MLNGSLCVKNCLEKKLKPLSAWQFADELFEYVWPFCGIGAYRVNNVFSNGFFFTRLDLKFRVFLFIFDL